MTNYNKNLNVVEDKRSFFEKLFSDSGSVSSMRVMSMISLLTGCVIGLAVAFKYDVSELTSCVPLVSVFVGGAFGGKVWQKYTENAVERTKISYDKGV